MRRRTYGTAVFAALVFAMTTNGWNAVASSSGNALRRPREVYEARLADWRTHQVVYQVFVDRFAAGSDPATRAAQYAPPRRLLPWTTQPAKGAYIEKEGVWSHEVDFWGGDLKGVTDRLDYIKVLGCDVVYLNPIFLAYTNHKYDATDFFTIDPQYGTRADFDRLCAEAHARGMRVVLDGVFNHTGRRAIWFLSGASDPSSPYRSFYRFGPEYKNGYLGWIDLANLPELNFENPAVRDVIYRKPDSVVQSWLAQADGWRLDVAFELGPEVLGELTSAAHHARPDSYTVGEIYNYPADWFPSLDGVMDMYMSRIILSLSDGRMDGPRASEMIEALVADAGIEPLLRSWIVLSNHDRPRLKSVLPDLRDRAFAWSLAATLPGAPLVYYGEEVGLAGADDPENRGPMRWDLVGQTPPPPELAITQRLLTLRNSRRALQVGEFVRIPSSRLFAFTRMTDSVRDTVVVVANPTGEPITETIGPRDGFLQDDSVLVDLVGGSQVKIYAGLMTVTVPPKTVQAFAPVMITKPGYDRYKRVP